MLRVSSRKSFTIIWKISRNKQSWKSAFCLMSQEALISFPGWWQSGVPWRSSTGYQATALADRQIWPQWSFFGEWLVARGSKSEVELKIVPLTNGTMNWQKLFVFGPFFASIFACVIVHNRGWMTTIRVMHEEGDDSQLHTALAHIIVIAAVWAATPLGTVVRVTYLHARQRTAGPPTRGHTGAVQHSSKANHTCEKENNTQWQFSCLFFRKMPTPWKNKKSWTNHIQKLVIWSRCGLHAWSTGRCSELTLCTNSCSRIDRPGGDNAAGRCTGWWSRGTGRTHSPPAPHTAKHRTLEHTTDTYYWQKPVQKN